MNFVEQERVYCDKEEEEQELEEEEELMMTTTSKLPFPSPNSSSSSSSTKYRDFLPQHHCSNSLWLSSSDQHCQQDYKAQESSPSFDKRLDLMDLSLGNDNNNAMAVAAASSGSIEREHMFDKVVTPSDVGKLNRLVIPKQHAERYFPLDSSSNEKGLLLNFEDRNGKPWRFRYSYWNSSQSYVMTKGWSRFVKEKKLDAGDIVSFQRGVGESGKHRLYIDWRRRPAAPDPTSFAHLELQNQLHFPQSVRWGRLYSLPQPLSMPRIPCEQSQFHHFNYSIQPYHHHHHQPYQYHPHQQQPTSYASAAASQYYARPPTSLPSAAGIQIGAVPHQQQQQQGGNYQVSMVIDSIPVVHGRSVGKRLRLFGVNMECPTQDDQSSSSDNVPQHGSGILGALSPQLPSQTRVPSSSNGPTPTLRQADYLHEFSKKGKSSLSFDLDL